MKSINTVASEPIISVLTSASNVADYVEETIWSLQRQTISNFEIVVVDDGSTDNTYQLLERMASLDPRIVLLRLAQNCGLTRARNFGFPHCRAPYIACIDCDDVAAPDRLEKQLALLKASPEISLVGCSTLGIQEDGTPYGAGTSPVPVSQEAIARTLTFSAPCSHVWMARREVYEKLGGYRDLQVAEDYDFLLRAVTSGFKLSNVREPLMYIRNRPGQTAEVRALMHRKAHHYVVSLYRERLRAGLDSFCRRSFDSAVHSGRTEVAVHKIADKCAREGLKRHNYVAKFLLLTLASMISPWQARYFVDRARFKYALRKNDLPAMSLDHRESLT